MRFRFDCEADLCNMNFNPFSPWAKELPNIYRHTPFLFTMMAEMSWDDREDMVLSRWTPHLFGILQSDAALRSPTTPASDTFKNRPVLASLPG
eukprot:198751-Pyramimonas_sp.AAC.1